MNKTSIKINKMDCPSEIKLIEGLMENLDESARMEFDLESRTVHFYHSIVQGRGGRAVQHALCLYTDKKDRSHDWYQPWLARMYLP